MSFPLVQVFAMTGWYPCVKQALLDRGWYYNSDPTSPYFDLKWTLRSIDVSQETLQPHQLTNHFLKNVAITTKVRQNPIPIFFSFFSHFFSNLSSYLLCRSFFHLLIYLFIYIYIHYIS